MKRGYLFIDSTPNVGIGGSAQTKSVVPREMKKPKLQEKSVEERVMEEEKEDKQKVSAYSVLVDETGKERDDYEEDESGSKRQEIMDAIEIAKARGDAMSQSKLEELLEEFEKEQSERYKDEQGESGKEFVFPDEPSVISKNLVDLVKDFEEVERETNDVKSGVFTNVTSKLTGEFQRSFEKLGGEKEVYDPVEMHEYAKLVNASYEFFEHRDFGRTRDYLMGEKNAYIPKFNEWRADETYSSADNLVFVKFGRDLNNPRIVIACRGTVTGDDWLTNVNMVMGGTEQTKRFEELEETFNRLKSQYPEANIEVTGHSQGGGLSYALAQKYNLKGYHYDPAIFPSFRVVMKNMIQSWNNASIGNLGGYYDTSKRNVQMVYKNGVDPASMMMSLLDVDKNVKIRTVDVKSVSNTRISSIHSLQNYYVDGYDGDVSKGVRVMRGGNTRKIMEPLLKRAAGMSFVKKTGSVGGAVSVGMTVNDTYHALKRMEADQTLTQSEKRAKQWLRTGKNVADFALSAGVGVSAEAAAASMLTAMGATGAVAVGAPLLMGAAAALVASEGIKWIGGSIEKHADVLSRMVDPQLVDVANVAPRKRRKNSKSSGSVGI